ncbi:MAG: uridine kinase [Lachnospiraceae bacterium]|nr:uridine kinase [Lachnospiraceae bacterium]MBP3806267.1 uridine kinase [Oribacterium sp.]
MSCIMIGIAGGSGSGKSTFTNRLKAEFGDKVTVIYHDNYYKSNDGVPFEIRQKSNYDSPDAFETDLLITHLKALRRGETVQCPVYDYSQHNRTAETVSLKPSKIVIVEGILVLENPELRSLFDIKIYVEADADERIIRRIIRDVKERGRQVEDISSQYLTTVKPMHYLYVEPTKQKADIVINSGMNDVAFDLMKTKIKSLLENGGNNTNAL